ncbi:hypothetical protein [Bauldia sp.]|uniref:hypothetical protein n=1 Tax=Bauldia sp. TaxID=2575872 RepID=UPI003BACEAFD
MPVPYLDPPPPVITIDGARQLFVDDLLVERRSLTRTFHRPIPHPDNPLLKPEAVWETGHVPFAMPFSDGAWFDPDEGLFKLWYAGNEMWCTCMATSRDGIRWERPILDVVPQTNIVLDVPRDSSTVWRDPDGDPAERFKMIQTVKKKLSMTEPLVGEATGTFAFTLTYYASPDGVHWTKRAESPVKDATGDRSTFWRDPFRGTWVYSLRDIGWQKEPGSQPYRVRSFFEHTDLADGLAHIGDAVPWVGADDLDPPNPAWPDQPAQLYTLDATPYEGLMVGLFSVHQGPENDVCADKGLQKRNQITLGFSRDGFHWDRPDRGPFIRAQERDGAWDWGNIQSVGGGFCVIGDELRFYYSGRGRWDGFWDGNGATGLAVLRRDGFASLDADRDGGMLVTRPVRFSGAHLFVNLEAPGGRLRVAVLDETNNPIPGFCLSDCEPVTGDGTQLAVRWRGADLPAMRGRPVRLQFELFSGSLYAFWVSAYPTGESGGHVAAGGPGFQHTRDRPAEPGS